MKGLLMRYFLLQATVALAATRAPVTSLRGGAHDVSMLNTDTKVQMKPPEGTETVEHRKEPNGGYKKGSPLYNKQEGIEPKEKKAEHPTPLHDEVAKAVENIPVDGNGVDLQKHHDEVTGKAFWETVQGLAVYAVLVLAFAFFQSKRQFQPLGARTGGNSRVKLPEWTNCGFAYSFFDCGNIKQDWPICLRAFCCPIVQWADTSSRAAKPFMGFWKGVVLLLVLFMLGPFTFGITYFAIAVILYMRRRHIRDTYGHETPATTSMIQDICCVFCCSQFECCALVQEAREVDYTTPSK